MTTQPNAAARVVPAKLEVLRAQAAVARRDGCVSGPGWYRAGAARERADDADFRAHIGHCRRISSGNETAASSVPAESFLDRQGTHSTRIEPGRTAWRDVLEKARFPMQRLPTWDRCNEPTHENRDFQHQ
jgi:hypothetical protein